jgi:hypothetical protein
VTTSLLSGRDERTLWLNLRRGAEPCPHVPQGFWLLRAPVVHSRDASPPLAARGGASQKAFRTACPSNAVPRVLGAPYVGLLPTVQHAPDRRCTACLGHRTTLLATARTCGA